MNIPKRMGTFFLVMSLALLVLFFASDALEMPNGWYLLAGAVSLGVGIALSRQGKEDSKPVQRFRMIRRMFASDNPQDREKERQDKDLET